MAGNGNNPDFTITSPEVNRLRASGPILILAILFVVGAFLTWYFTWFGRDLSDSDISQYLLDAKRPRRVQHALLQVQQRIAAGDQDAKQWYPQLVRLASNSETEFRLTVAWLMGFDNTSEDFHRTLLQLVRDGEPIVRRNAALALVRFSDPSGRAELRATLQPYPLRATAEGVVISTLNEGAQVGRGALLVRIGQPDLKTVEVRSPLPGSLDEIRVPSGANVALNETLLTINSDEESVWEALRGLSLIGKSEDLIVVGPYAQDSAQADRIRKQAALTVKAIRSRKDGDSQKAMQ